jgi:F-type H+-transporting ATPase subunit delta
MIQSRVDQRYALALLEVAGEKGARDAVDRDMTLLEGLIAQSRDFNMFLRSPVINLHRKQKVFGDLLGGRVHEATLLFVQLLAHKNREKHLPGIIAQYRRLRDEQEGIVNVTVRTVVPLTTAEDEAITTRLKNSIRKKIRVSSVMDPSITGGFTIRFEDTVWDASVRHQLENLRKRLMDTDHGA